jgi:hypothetical protein
MPNKYEREIEEILRNLEQTEPKAGLGQKFGERFRRRPDRRMNTRRRSFLSFNFGVAEWCLIIACSAALLAGGWAYAQQEANVYTGILAVIGAVCLALIVLIPFLYRSRYPTQSSRYGNVTPLRRNPLNSLTSRWNLFLLKLRYRRRRDH